MGGHAGILIYDKKGITRYYEYGRYPKDNVIGKAFSSDEGNIRRLSVPNLNLDKDGQPTLDSLDNLKQFLKKNAGKNTKIELICDSNADENKIIEYIDKIAKDAERAKYSWKPWNSNQCRDFSRNAFNAGR